jgi:hypothetical protein
MLFLAVMTRLDQPGQLLPNSQIRPTVPPQFWLLPAQQVLAHKALWLLAPHGTPGANLLGWMLLHDDGFELTGGILMIEGTLLTLGLDDALGEVLRLGFDEKSNVGYR